MRRKSILVTGGSGFAGGHLLDLLATLPETDALAATCFPAEAQPPPRQVAEAEVGMRKEILVGNLDAERDFIDIRDVVRAYAMIADAGIPGRP